jgi:hypothetical protein
MIEHYSYVLKDEIGKGYSCVVYKGKDEKTDEIVAIKVNSYFVNSFLGPRYEENNQRSGKITALVGDSSDEAHVLPECDQNA